MSRNAFIALILAWSLSPVCGQQPTAPNPVKWPTEPVPPLQQQKPPAIDAEDVVRITTNLVQIDTVVTRDNKQITDLTAQDFEIFEDGKPQPITNFSYVWTVPKTATTSGELPKAVAPDKDAPRVPPAPVKAEESHRTIALVIDDLGIAMENTASIRRQLRKFIDEQMQPNDLVAVIRTGGEVGALQQFTNDKRILSRAIESIRWNQNSRAGISTFAAYGDDTSPRGGANGVGLAGNPQTSDTYNATLRALRFIMLGMRDIPGRKSMVVFSEDLPTDTPDYALPSGPISPQQSAQGAEPGLRGAQRSVSIGAALQRLAELAIRSSIVIYGVDTRGLAPFGPTAATNVQPMLSPVADQPFAAMSLQSHILQETRTGQDLLTKETGGFLIKNSNNFALKRIAEDQAGYYLIGYRPSGDTFNRRFHHINVKVKRQGLTVRTRSGFFGMTDEETRPMQMTNMDRINMALMSPFGAADIEVHLTALYADVARFGSMLRSLIHFSGSSLKFIDAPGGSHTATFNLAAVVFADNGTILQKVIETRTVRVTQKDYERVLRQGLAYRVDVPITKPGAYQFRVAVRDDGSSLIGTARQFVDVPELKKHNLTLSGITVSGDETNAEVSDRGGAVTNFSSPAIRRFAQGSNLWFGYSVYNAQLDKAAQVSALTAQAKIFRDGQVVYTGVPKQLDPTGQLDLKRISAGGGIKLGSTLDPGEYQLQIVITEAGKDKPRTASQWIDFEIVK
jgi:VWFA-related protein